MKNVIKAALFALVATSSVVAGASAQTLVYTSFTGHGKHAALGPQTVGTGGDHLGYLPAGYIALAASFVPAVSGNLDHYDVSLGAISGFAGATLTLVDDNGSGAPNVQSGHVYETIVAQKLPTDNQNTTKNTLLRSVNKPALVAGTTYWLILTTAAYDGNLEWYQSNQTDNRVLFTKDGGQTYSGYTGSQTAFDVWVK